MVDLHFHDEVSDRKGAEAFLYEQASGTYVTWRASDKSFFLSYTSPATLQPHHLHIVREPDGRFYLEDARARTKYDTLGALLADRSYLRRDGGADAPSARPNEAAAGLRQRHPDLAGSATLPAHVLPPAVDAAVLAKTDDDYLSEKKWSRGIKASCPDGVLYTLFASGVMTGGAAGGAAWWAHREYDDAVTAVAERMAVITRGVVDAASARLFGGLLELEEGTGTDVPAACSALVHEWRDAMEGLPATLQPLYSASGADAYLGMLLAGCGVCIAFALCLQCTHTGRRRKKYTPTEQDFLAGPLAKDKLCSHMQVMWTATYLSLLVTALGTGGLLASHLWALGATPTMVQYAGRTLSNAFPSDVRAQTGRGKYSPEDMFQGAVKRGMWGAAGVLAGVPAPCMAAFEPVVEDVIYLPAILRSAPLPPVAAHLLRPFLLPAPEARPAGEHDPLCIRNPVAWPRAMKGWFDDVGVVCGGGAPPFHRLSVVLPTQTAVTYSSMNVIASFMAAAILMLILQEQVLGSWLPDARRAWKDYTRAPRAHVAPAEIDVRGDSKRKGE